MELTGNHAASAELLMLARKEQLEAIRRSIIDLPGPVEDPNWNNHDGEWRTYGGWMLETRANILGLLRAWPDHAPILKTSLANTVYHKAVFGQISKAHFENQFESNIYAKTHPLLPLNEAPATDTEAGHDLHDIYIERQVMLIAFVQLFEWLTQDDEKLVPAGLGFAEFRGKIRLPEHWIAAVGPIKAQRFGMVLYADGVDSDRTLPVRQFNSNILPVPRVLPVSNLSLAQQPTNEESILPLTNTLVNKKLAANEREASLTGLLSFGVQPSEVAEWITNYLFAPKTGKMITKSKQRVWSLVEALCWHQVVNLPHKELSKLIGETWGVPYSARMCKYPENWVGIVEPLKDTVSNMKITAKAKASKR